jgi:hypothetical protein
LSMENKPTHTYLTQIMAEARSLVIQKGSIHYALVVNVIPR